MVIDPVPILRQLVAIPSVNPMGRSVSGPPYGESRLTDYLEQLCRKLGLAVQRQPVAPGQDNLIARLDGDSSPAGSPTPSQPARVVVLVAHQDTVPVDGMTIEPFAAEIRDGRLYGRGACDTKGGMAAMLAAVARLAVARPTPRPAVVLAFTVNEEDGFSGASALARSWSSDSPSMVARKPDVAVVAEPTGLAIVVAHKGVVRWRCHARGRAAHSSRPESGENAIYKMGRALRAMERCQRDLAATLESHPLCGPATFSVGTIQGGVSVNTVPDRCTVEIDCRFPPGESPESARRRVIDFLAADPDVDFPLDHDPPYLAGPPLSDAANGPLAERLAAAVPAGWTVEAG